jgi:hypothetical protein
VYLAVVGRTQAGDVLQNILAALRQRLNTPVRPLIPNGDERNRGGTASVDKWAALDPASLVERHRTCSHGWRKRTALVSRVVSRKHPAAMPTAPTVKSIMLPRYDAARRLLGILNGCPRSTITGMLGSIYLWTGTPKEQRSWHDPLQWIDSLLEGAERDLAHRIWKESGKTIHPRYVKGAHLFLNKHDLLSVRDDGRYEITPKGARFAQDDLCTVAEIDTAEGLLELLMAVEPASTESSL